MKRLFLLLLLFWTQENMHAQNINVEYFVKVNTHSGITSTNIKYQLLIKGNEAAYFNNPADSLSQFKYAVIGNSKQMGDVKTVKLSDNHYASIKEDYFYKNYVQDTLIFNDLITRKKMIVGESISKLFSWTIVPNQDSTFLGYRCQQAITEFRGRKYIAYFNSEINAFGGPWKFDGLPGLILSVRSEDNYFIIEPTKIAINQAIEVIHNPYKDLRKGEIISWEQFKKTFREKMEAQLAKLKAISDKGEGGSIRIDKIEDVGFTELSFTK